jgi:hypothetical protein
LKKKIIAREIKSNSDQQKDLIEELMNMPLTSSVEPEAVQEESFLTFQEEKTPPKKVQSPQVPGPSRASPQFSTYSQPGTSKSFYGPSKPSAPSQKVPIPKITKTPPQSPSSKNDFSSSAQFLKPPSPGRKMQTSTPIKSNANENLQSSVVIIFPADETFRKITSDKYFPQSELRGVMSTLKRILGVLGEDQNKSMNITSMTLNIAPGKYDIYKMK